ncbi:hypothetical protein [Glycomyces buryatensis]|uniref:Uncharacterized protein n=1 Tax=Glycomyces buryatensis TaxID=2570927 RepID=A0A4S8QJC3_9ACTN|nr:hypothetical protein [Glycomyces buryatensis]THV41469.1 hypothetical protein FAB82_11780 [Glycomyces buryatensis]
MFKVEWTAHELKPQAEIDELYGELQASIEIDGPGDLAVLIYAAKLLETGYAVARITGYPDRDWVLDYSDIVEFFMCLDAVVEALDAHSAGVIELYPGPDRTEFIVFDAGTGDVRLYRVPWLETTTFEPNSPLPRRITGRPMTTCARRDLVSHFSDLRREFARAAVEHDPRLAVLEPISRWSPN